MKTIRDYRAYLEQELKSAILKRNNSKPYERDYREFEGKIQGLHIAIDGLVDTQ